MNSADFAADRLKNILIKDKVKAQQGFIDVKGGFVKAARRLFRAVKRRLR